MLALSKAGAKVLHAKSAELAMTNSVNLRLLSSFEEGEGSAVRLLPEAARPRIAGITGRQETGRVTLVGKGADAMALSEAVLLLGRAGIAVLDGKLAENALSLAVPPEDHPAAMALLHVEMILSQYE